MERITLAIGSVTYAIKARNLLTKSGVNAKIVKVDRPDFGCTHGVSLNHDDLLNAASILRSASIDYTLLSN